MVIVGVLAHHIHFEPEFKNNYGLGNDVKIKAQEMVNEYLSNPEKSKTGDVGKINSRLLKSRNILLLVRH